MGSDCSVHHGRSVGNTVAVRIIQIRSSLVVPFHPIGERKVAKTWLNNITRRCEHTPAPCALVRRNIKRSPTIPTVLVPVIIDVPWIDWIGCPVVNGGCIFHPVERIAVFPTISDSIAIGVIACWISNTNQCSVEIVEVEFVDFFHSIGTVL